MRGVDHRTPRSDIAKCAVPACPNCDATEREFLVKVREHEYDNTTDDEFSFWECSSCGAWYLDPRPDVSTLDVIYPPNYYAFVWEADQGPPSMMGRLLRSRVQHAMNRMVRPWMEPRPGRLALDIGCGPGLALEFLQEMVGGTAKGIDMSAEAVATCRAKGFEAEQVRFEDYQPPGDERYDLIHSSHVIEHLESPRAYMEKVASLLKPGGISIFATPNTDAWEAKRLGRHWGALHAPRHWTLLSPKSARLLGERYGLEFLETVFSPNAVFWLWSLHSAGTTWSRPVSDALFPSDHRWLSGGVLNFGRLASLSLIDRLSHGLSGRTANMTVIHRKPL